MKIDRKEKGQGLVEYALILLIVAIVVIGVNLLIAPIIRDVITDIADKEARAAYKNPTNAEVLKDAPYIHEGINTPYLITPGSVYVATSFDPGCTDLMKPEVGYSLKVGTSFQPSEYIVVFRKDIDGHLFLCNNTDGPVDVILVHVQIPQ